jgi:serine/threonine protein kinase
LPLTPGSRLGVYEITTLLGEGGMGQVYRARDTRLDRSVAIKVLPGAFAQGPQLLPMAVTSSSTCKVRRTLPESTWARSI